MPQDVIAEIIMRFSKNDTEMCKKLFNKRPLWCDLKISNSNSVETRESKTQTKFGSNLEGVHKFWQGNGKEDFKKKMHDLCDLDL